MNIDWLFKNIETITDEEFHRFSESIIYLDSEQLSALYSGLSGLKGRPLAEIQKVSGEIKASFLIGAGVSGDISKSFEISDSYLLKAILPKLRDKYTDVIDRNAFKQSQKQRVWIKGDFNNKSSIYLDPNNFNVANIKDYKPIIKTKTWTEFHFEDINCDLPVIENYLSSIYRSLLFSKKSFEENVELFGYIHKLNEIKTGTSDHPTTSYIAIISPIFIFKRET